MNDLLITGRARTVAYTHDTLLGEARALAHVFEVSSLAHELLVVDPKPNFDLLDYRSLLPPAPHVWVEFEVPPVTNLEGRLEVLPLGLTGVGAYVVTTDLEQLGRAEHQEVFSFLPWRVRRRVRQRTRYLVTAFFMVEMVEEARPLERALAGPVLAHYYYLDLEGRMTFERVVQHIYNAVKMLGPAPEGFFESFRSFQYPVFEAFERLRQGMRLESVPAEGRDHEGAEVVVEMAMWP